MGTSPPQGTAVPGRGHAVPSVPGRAPADCLAPERVGLLALSLLETVVSTILRARVPSTRAAYAFCWAVFSAWCQSWHVDPLLAGVPVILNYIQHHLCLGKAVVTREAWLQPFLRCPHDAYRALISRFLQGARRTSAPRSAPSVLPWDLDVVLRALHRSPFEPLYGACWRWLPLKTTFLLAMASARRVSELHTLSVHADCCHFLLQNSWAILRPHPTFLPKVLSDFQLRQSIKLRALGALAALAADAGAGVALCPVCALQLYITRTQQVRQTDQLFVCFQSSLLGQPLSKSRLAGWIVQLIRHAYEQSGLPFPPGVHAHSTRGMATSSALFRGASLVSATENSKTHLNSTACSILHYFT